MLQYRSTFREVTIQNSGGENTQDPEIGKLEHIYYLQHSYSTRLRQQQAQKKGSHNDDKVVVPWYVMTSGPTRGPTESYFEVRIPLLVILVFQLCRL